MAKWIPILQAIFSTVLRIICVQEILACGSKRLLKLIPAVPAMCDFFDRACFLKFATYWIFDAANSHFSFFINAVLNQH